MLYREIISVCSDIHTEHVNTLCGQNVEFVKATACGFNQLTHLWPLKGLSTHKVTGSESAVIWHCDLQTVLKCSELACRWVQPEITYLKKKKKTKLEKLVYFNRF